MWSYWICDTRTGAKLVPVEPSIPGRIGHRLSGGVSGQTTFILNDSSVLLDDDLTRPWARTLVLCWNDVVKYAGLIVRDPFDEDEQTLTVHHQDIEMFLEDSRYPFGTSSYWADEPNHIPGSITITGKSVRAAVGKLVEQSCLGPSPIYSLPIVLPNLSEAGPFTDTFHNYNFESLGEHLSNFRALGFDIEFEPRWSTSGTLEWLLRVGTTDSPSIEGDIYDFDQTAEKRRLKNVSYERDGTLQLTGQFGVGRGSEALMRVGGDGIEGTATIPARDSLEFYKNESSESRLAEYGLAAVVAHEHPTFNWSMSMLATEEPGFENMRMGVLLKMAWAGSRRIPDGPHATRLIGWTVQDGDTIQLDAQTWS
jgi:hypothetical protein